MQSLCILHNSNDVVVVNKPSGIGMHDTQAELPLSPHLQQFSNQDVSMIPGIVSLLKKQLHLPQLFLCHRLDTGTSGCLCLAKNKRAAAEIGELFKKKLVSKYYLALSNNKPKKKQGTIIGDMKNRRSGQRILVKSTERPAITQFFTQSAKPGVRGFVVKPYTGRTHQIRVALKSMGAPIYGDVLYGGDHAQRLHLHAWQLTLPLQSGTVRVIANVDTSVALFESNAFSFQQYDDGFADPQVQEWILQLQSPDNLSWPNLPKRFDNELHGSNALKITMQENK